jgi:diguanylate cyclase (GGDEF)-like protein
MPPSASPLDSDFPPDRPSERRVPHRDGTAPLRVLAIAAHPSIVTGLREAVGPQVVLTVVSEARPGLACARIELPDLILVEPGLPAPGRPLLQQLRDEPALAAVPVVAVLPEGERQLAVQAVALGAAEVVCAPAEPGALRLRMDMARVRHNALESLARAALVDPLTGLGNRSFLNARLDESVARLDRDPAYGFALVFIDFDRFKAVNDTLGHEVGDLMLVEVADRLRQMLRGPDAAAPDGRGDTISRLGGDEFVVMLDGVVDAARAVATAERLLKGLSEPYRVAEHTLHMSASLGVVHSRVGYAQADAMLRDADIAMYEAKARGKACVVAFEPHMGEALTLRVSTEAALRESVGTGQLFLVYQPIVSLHDNRLEGVEAFARWQHPERGLLAPADFIRVAEEARLMLGLGEELLRRGCADFMAWQQDDPHRAPQYLSINLSRVQIADPMLVSRMLRIVRESGMRPDQLQLEVTESHLLANTHGVSDRLVTLREAGVRLALDNFGSIGSSLASLQAYPLSTFKIDRVLVAGAGDRMAYAAMLHAVLTMADNLGLHAVAEGIETDEQLTLLQSLGCPSGQGYLMARPMPGAGLQAWWQGRPGRGMLCA